MPVITKRKVAVNPGRRKRRNSGTKKRLTSKQIKFFGTKAQRAALKRRGKRKNPSIKKLYKKVRRTLGFKNRGRRRRRNVSYGGVIDTGVYKYYGSASTKRRKTRGTSKKSKSRRRKNIGSILTVLPNPGRRKRSSRVARTRKRNRSYSRRHRTSNPGRRRHVSRGIRRYARRHRRNPGMRRHSYRRNPGMLSGTIGRVAGVIGGAALTNFAVGFIPASLTSNPIMGYAAIGATAVLQGKLVGKVSKNSALGTDFMVGGLVFLALKVIKDFMPSIGGNLGLSGMGLIAPSSFYTPQVNQPGSMGRFIVPAATPAPVMVNAGHGMGAVRRVGRVR